MANYHVNPATGVDTNSGLTWALAWKTLNGLRVNAVVPGAGDLVKIAKSAVVTPTGGSWTTYTQAGVAVVWEGSTIFSQAATTDHPYYSGTQYSPYPLVVNYLASGVAAQTYSEFRPKPPMRMVSASGQLNTPSVKLGHYVTQASYPGNNYRGILCMFRCIPAYSGAGDQNIPAGTFVIKLCSDTAGNNAVASFTVNKAIRNSGDWTLFWAELGAPFGGGLVQSVSLWRTAATLNRDSSTWGIEWSPPKCINSSYSFNYNGVASHAMYTPQAYGVYSYGFDSSTLCIEEIAEQAHYNSYGFYPTSYSDVNAIRNQYAAAYNTAYPANPADGAWDLENVGTALWPLADSASKGAFDLNGSAGGTLVDPLVIRGGYNTGTDLVDGVTVYSAYRPQVAPTSCALFDLNYANHVRIENIVPVHGWGSIVARPGILTLYRCHLPWGYGPPFIFTTASTHITLESMFIQFSRLEFLGVFEGDLTLKKVYASARIDTATPNRYFEVGKLTIANSHLGEGDFTSQKTGFKWCMRDDSVLEDVPLVAPPRLVQVAWGKTLVIRNYRDNGTGQDANYVTTAPESKWAVIDYQPATWPNATWSSSPGIHPDTADQLIKALSLDAAKVNNWGWGTTMFHTTDGVGSYAIRFAQTGQRSADIVLPLTLTTYQYPSGAFIQLPYYYAYVSAPVNAYANVYDRMIQTPAVGNGVTRYMHEAQTDVTYRKARAMYIGQLGLPQAVPLDAQPPLFLVYCLANTPYMLHIGFMCKNLNYTGYRTDPAVGYKLIPSASVSYAYTGFSVEVKAKGLSPSILQAFTRPAGSNTWNANLDYWEDIYIPFTLTEEGFVTVKWYNKDDQTVIFDTLEVYAE